MARYQIVGGGDVPDDDRIGVSRDDRMAAARIGARIVGDWADRVQVTQGDLDRWADTLMEGFRVKVTTEADETFSIGLVRYELASDDMYPRGKAAAEADRRDAVERLRKLLRPGMEVQCVLRSCSRSGMRRRVSLIALDPVTGPFHLDALAARALQWSRVRQYPGEGVVVDGCGMDMGFHLVYSLASVVFGDYVVPLRGADRGRLTRWRNGRGEWSPKDAGYALRHRWL